MAHKIEFANRHGLRSEWRQQHLDPAAFWRRAGLTAGGTALDIGAGTGFFAIPATEIVGSAGRVLAVDTSLEMLAELASFVPLELADRLDRIQSEEYRIPLDSGVADVALLAFVTHEVDEPARLLTEATRLIKPGGHILVLDWDPDVEPPPGPPTEVRLAADAAAEALGAAGATLLARGVPAPGVYELLARRAGG